MDELKQSRVRLIFDNANFVHDLGLQLTRIEDEYCETVLIPSERHRQQHGLIHAHVMATMADHTSGCAAQ
jgi:acyl-coenzyme A thioesterase PaaI-like protein